MSEEEPSSEVRQRRDVLKKGLVAGGLVWAAPMVTSFVSPAGAQGSSCGGDCAAIAIGGPIQFEGRDWFVPLDLTTACPGCFQAATVNVVSNASSNIESATATPDGVTLTIADGSCGDNVTVFVLVGASIDCGGSTIQCCILLDFALTSFGPGCDEYTVEGNGSNAGAGICD